MLRRLNGRTFQIAALAAALVLSAKPGASEPSKDDAGKTKPSTSEPSKAKIKACKTTYKTAVALEESGHLRQAKDTYLTCAKIACGAHIKQLCTSRYSQLESDIPSVVPLVTDEGGDPKTDVQVTVDNELLTSKIDGRALPVDPGLHEFSFSADGAVIATQKVMVVQGQRNRPLNVALGDKHGKKAVLGAALPAGGLDAKASAEKPIRDRDSLEKPEKEAPLPDKSAATEKASSDKSSSDWNSADSPTPETKSKGGPGAAPYLIGVVGLAGLGAYGAFTYWGRKDNDLLGNCAPNCNPASVDHIRKLYLAADVSAGVGAAALATSLIWFVASPSSKEKAPSQAAYRFDVQPSPSGGYATVSGSF